MPYVIKYMIFIVSNPALRSTPHPCHLLSLESPSLHPISHHPFSRPPLALHPPYPLSLPTLSTYSLHPHSTHSPLTLHSLSTHALHPHSLHLLTLRPHPAPVALTEAPLAPLVLGSAAPRLHSFSLPVLLHWCRLGPPSNPGFPSHTVSPGRAHMQSGPPSGGWRACR